MSAASGSEQRGCSALAAGDGGNDRDGFARRNNGVETGEEADVVVGHEQVHELAQVSAVVEQTVVETGMRGIERGEHIAQRVTIDLDLVLATRKGTKGGGNADLGGHDRHLSEDATKADSLGQLSRRARPF